MLAPTGWIKKYTDVTVADLGAGAVHPRDFAQRMTMTGTKVEGYEQERGSMHGIVTGKVLSMKRHENSDHMWVCEVDTGSDRLQIVTGAQNVHEGDIVPVATDGSEIHGGKQIHTGELRGVKSEGMLCSLGELGLTAHDYPECIEDGIMILSAETPVGADALTLFGMDDYIYDFEITPNRPDCLCVAGIAREVAASYGKPFSLEKPSVKKTGDEIKELLSVSNETPKNCLRYSAAMVRNVRVKPSPEWMRRWLRQCGVRPINNIVDITNFVMLEYNQPMHAFDYKNVKDGHIIVRQAKPGEEIMTLDGVERALTADMMIIADSEKPIAVAGVMGGEYSGITDDTNTVVFESACFNGVNVRFTAKGLGMRTEASARYEKGLDPENTVPALMRTLELIEQLDAGDVVGGVADIRGDIPTPRKIKLDPAKVNAFLGTDISEQFMVDTLRTLEFDVGAELTVTPPSFRADVEGEADLAEEVARIYGYDEIPNTIMNGIAVARPTERQRFDRKLINVCVGAGLYELCTYSFMSPKSLDMLRLPADSGLRNAVRITNPLGEDTSLMRTTMAPSTLDCVARNFASRAEDCALFELASVYRPKASADELPDEPRTLAIGGFGKLGFFELKGIVEAVLRVANVIDAGFEAARDVPYLHPGRAARVFVDGTELGVFGELHPDVISAFDCAPKSVMCELDIDKLYELRREQPAYEQLPRFPALTRDLALVCDRELPAAKLEEIIKQACGKALETIRVFDVYTGTGIPDDKKSVAFGLRLRDKERTLTDEEADSAIGRALEKLKQVGAELRR